MNKRELIGILSNIEGNPDVRVFCSHNLYDIRNIVVTEDVVIVSVGESNNPPAEDYDSFEPLNVA